MRGHPEPDSCVQLPPFLRLRFTLAAERPGRLPPYLGSLLRGAFGRALRRSSCALSADEPGGSGPEHRSCPYRRLFEPFAGGPQPFLAGEPTAPRPYLFEPRTRGGDLGTDSHLQFDLILIGDAMDLGDVAVRAVRDMAARGLGTDRHPFRLVRSERIEATLQPSPEAESTGQNAASSNASGDHVTLRWLTPLRLISNGRRVEQLSFEELVDRAVQRQQALAHLFDRQPAPEPGARERWRAVAGEVRVERSELHWLDLHRYSHRQRRRHPLGGLVGEMELRGHLEPLRGVLWGMEIFHVGKGTTFGLGRVELAP